MKAIIVRAPKATPAPIPALAPVLSPPLSGDAVEVAVDVGLLVVEEDVVLVALVELIVLDELGVIDVPEMPKPVCNITVLVIALGAIALKVSFVGESQCGPALVAPQHAHISLLLLYITSV